MLTIFTTLSSQLNKRAVMLKYSDKISSHSKEISQDTNIDPPAASTMINTSNGTVSVNSENRVDSVGHANTVVNVDNPPLSGKDQDDMLEATGNCLVNRNFQWPWLTTPFPDSMLPPVSNHVSMLKLDPFRIYNRETGEPIGVNHSTGRGPSDSEFEDIELSTGPSTPSTLYRVPVTNNIEVKD